MIPMSAVWAGETRDRHFKAPPLLFGQNRGINAIPVFAPCRRCRPYPGGRTDRCRQVGLVRADGPAIPPIPELAGLRVRFRWSIRAATLAMGGDWHDLGGALSDGAKRPQFVRCSRSPGSTILRSADRPPNGSARSWHAKRSRSRPEVKDHLWSALTSLASAPRQERTLTGLSVLLQSNVPETALQPYCLDGPSGRLLDAEFERLGEGSVQAFETEGLMGTSAAPAVLTYLFHRIGDVSTAGRHCSSSMRGGSPSTMRISPASCGNG